MASKHSFEEFLDGFQPINGTVGEMLKDAMIQAWNAALDAFTNAGLDYYDQSEFFKYPEPIEE